MEVPQFMTAKIIQTESSKSIETLKGVRLINPSSDYDGVVDVTIDQSGVLSINESAFNPSGLWLIPGLVDMHVHLRTPGYEDAETLSSGLRTAISGGVTAVGMMPNTSPPLDSIQLTEKLQKEAACLNLATVVPVPCVTLGRLGEECVDFKSFSKQGVRSFSDDGSPVQSDSALLAAFQEMALCEGVIIEHPEITELAKGGAVNEGEASLKLGVKGIPEKAEFNDVQRCIELLRKSKTAARLHLTHLSSPRSIALVRDARKSGLKVTCDVTPHHLVLNEDEVINRGTIAKMNPPLRSEKSRTELVDLVVKGCVTAIASDHAPHTLLKKNLPIEDAAFGIIGLDTILPLTVEILTEAGMKPLEVIRLLTTAPADILGISVPNIVEGDRMNMVLFDPTKEWDYSSSFSKSQNSPFWGTRLRGKVLRVWLNKEIFREGQFV